MTPIDAGFYVVFVLLVAVAAVAQQRHGATNPRPRIVFWVIGVALGVAYHCCRDQITIGRSSEEAGAPWCPVGALARPLSEL